MIEQMLEYNRQFVESKSYEKYQTSKYPDKKIAIVTCMDTRLVKNHPLVPKDVVVRGYIMDSDTGALKPLS